MQTSQKRALHAQEGPSGDISRISHDDGRCNLGALNTCRNGQMCASTRGTAAARLRRRGCGRRRACRVLKEDQEPHTLLCANMETRVCFTTSREEPTRQAQFSPQVLPRMRFRSPLFRVLVRGHYPSHRNTTLPSSVFEVLSFLERYPDICFPRAPARSPHATWRTTNPPSPPVWSVVLPSKPWGGGSRSLFALSRRTPGGALYLFPSRLVGRSHLKGVLGAR